MRDWSGRFGDLLRELREENGVGIKTLAPHLGVGYTYLSKLENGRSVPSDELIKRIAEYFGCDPDQLYLSADKLPPDLVDVIKRQPIESLRLLRSLDPNAKRSDR